MRTYKIPRVKLTYISDVSKVKEYVRCSQDSAVMLRESFEQGEIEMQEYFKVMYIDMKSSIIGIHTISMGGTDSTVVDARILFAGALTARATGIILCHNHPSGKIYPSVQDDNLTRKLVDGAKLLDMQILDHIILTSDNYFSYADEGRL